MNNNRLILRENANVYKGPCDYLENDLGFQSLLLWRGYNDNANAIISKKEALKNSLKMIRKMLSKRKIFKNADIILSIGNYTTLFLMLLNKLHIIKSKKYSGRVFLPQ